MLKGTSMPFRFLEYHLAKDAPMGDCRSEPRGEEATLRRAAGKHYWRSACLPGRAAAMVLLVICAAGGNCRVPEQAQEAPCCLSGDKCEYLSQKGCESRGGAWSQFETV